MSGMKGERLVCIALLLLCMLAPVPRCQAGAGGNCTALCQMTAGI